MIDIVTLCSLALATLHMAVAPASAHGYVSQPPSRQARCRDQGITGCGDARWEPQSVEAAKGSFSCNGDGARFPELNNDALWESHFFSVAPAWLSCLWALTNNVQKRKEEREKKGGFSNFIITQSFLVQFTQNKLQYVQKIHCYNYMHKNSKILLIKGQFLLLYIIFHLDFCMVH